MGVTLESKNYSIDLGYFGFNKLRTKVAELTAEDIGKYYKKLTLAPWLKGERKAWFEEYDKVIVKLSEKYNGEKDGVLDFLYASDCEGEMSVEVCKEIWEVIKNYDDNVLYGYVGRYDCAKFKDFKKIVKDCIDSDCSMTWI